jgi:hypothetical protein
VEIIDDIDNEEMVSSRSWRNWAIEQTMTKIILQCLNWGWSGSQENRFKLLKKERECKMKVMRKVTSYVYDLTKSGNQKIDEVRTDTIRWCYDTAEMRASKSIGWEQIYIRLENLQRGIVELANGAAVDARRELEVLQDLVQAKKRWEKKKKKAEEGASKNAKTEAIRQEKRTVTPGRQRRKQETRKVRREL